MKVLLIQSFLGGRDKSIAVYPIGLAYIGTSLINGGHDAKIFDPNVIAVDPLKVLERELLDYAPDVVGISLRNIDNQARFDPFYFYDLFRDLILQVRRILSDSTPIVVGGAGYSMFPKRILEENPDIDFGVYLEGEEIILNLLENLESPEKVKGIYFRKNGKIQYNGDAPLPDFEDLPFPRRDLNDIHLYNLPFTIGLQTKRGCPMQCAYCNYPALNGKQWRIRSVDNICLELEYLINECGVKQISFVDSIVNLPNKHAVAIFEEIVKRKIPVTWESYMSIKQVDKKFVSLAVAAGCRHMYFSPDAYSQEALDGMRKDITTTEIEKHISMFKIGWLKEWRGLHVSYSFFLASVGETTKGYLQTLYFIFMNKICLWGNKNMDIFNPCWIRIEPETKVCSVALDNGVLKSENDLLPSDTLGLLDTFYISPAVTFVDGTIFLLLKIAHFGKRLILRILGRSRKEQCKK